MRALLEAEADGEKLSVEEVIRFCITLVVAGAETTTFLIGNLLYNLATMKHVHQRLKDDPALLLPFIDETLRHSGPPQRLFRIATENVCVGNADIKKGDWVALFFAAANHDPAVFPDPGRFDMDRPNLNKQLTLGIGIHHCLGSALAKLEARVLLEGVLARGDEIMFGGSFPVPQTASLLNHGFERLVLRFVRKAEEAA
jgi:cytochrome P450